MTPRIRMIAGGVIALGFWASGITLTRAQVGHTPTPEQKAQRAVVRTAARTRSRLVYLVQHPGVDLAGEAMMTAEAESDDVFPEVRVMRFSDGAERIEVSTQTRLTAQEQSQYSYITIDRSRQTYRTFHWQSLRPTADEMNRIRQYYAVRGRVAQLDPPPDPSIWASARVRNAAFVPGANHAARRLSPAGIASAFNKPPATPRPQHRQEPLSLSTARASAQDSGCWGFYYLAIWTVDPAFIALNLDYIESDWADNSDNWDTYGRLYPWGAQPSAAGTNWFLSYEYPYYDPFPWWGTAWSQDDAEFYNTDFPLSAGQAVVTDQGGYLDFEWGELFGNAYWGARGAWTASYLNGVLQNGGQDGCYYGF